VWSEAKKIIRHRGGFSIRAKGSSGQVPDAPGVQDCL